MSAFIPKTYEDLYTFAQQNGLEATKSLLRKYMQDGQPNEFMPEYTTRAMCRAAGAGLDAIPIDQIPYSYMNTKHGAEIYWHMWATEQTNKE